MPPKSRITRQMILDASYQLVMESGIQALNVRSVAARLKCSTQPIMYHFTTMEELKSEVYAVVSAQHTAIIMDVDPVTDPKPCLTVSKRYIGFAMDNPQLFRFLFQSDRITNQTLQEMLESPRFAPFFDAMSEKLDITTKQAQQVFSSTLVATHGLSCLLANNSLEYDPVYTESMIDCIFNGALNIAKAQ